MAVQLICLSDHPLGLPSRQPWSYLTILRNKVFPSVRPHRHQHLLRPAPPAELDDVRRQRRRDRLQPLRHRRRPKRAALAHRGQERSHCQQVRTEHSIVSKSLSQSHSQTQSQSQIQNLEEVQSTIYIYLSLSHTQIYPFCKSRMPSFKKCHWIS